MIQKILDWFLKDKKEITRLTEALKSYDIQYNKLMVSYGDAVSNEENLKIKLFKTGEKLENAGLTPIDIYCRKKGYRKVTKWYQDKILNNVLMPVDLRELITVNSCLVQKTRKDIKPLADKFKHYSKVISRVNFLIRYKREKQDTYQYPNYTLAIRCGDCEDFSYLVSSIEPELAVVLGHYKKNGEKIYHAFNVGMINEVLYCFDATSKKSEAYNKVTGSFYINLYITVNQVYIADDSIEFGVIER